MIVVDTNIIAYLFLPIEFTVQAISLFRKDPVWAAPNLWRSEFRNVLSLYMRKELIDLSMAYEIQEKAESLLADFEFDVPSNSVLSLANESGCSAYDCEFIVLAQQLDVALVTQDKQILVAAPTAAVSLDDFLGAGMSVDPI